MLPFFVVARHALSWCCRKWALLNKSVFHHSRWLYGIILGLLLHSQHTMPYKHNESRRHKIKKSRYKVTNWHDYNNVLRQRGDFTIWFTEVEKIFQLFPLFSAVFPINKNSGYIKNNKIVINNWQTLTLFYCKTGKFSTLFCISKRAQWTQINSW